MKKSTSLIISGILAAIAVYFVVYAADHPEASFLWSNRITYMIYGVYVWLLLKFLVDIPFPLSKRKAHSRGNLISLLEGFGSMQSSPIFDSGTGKWQLLSLSLW